MARSGCCSGDLPHSDSPPTQHRPCAKPAGQVGSFTVRGCRNRGYGYRVGEAKGEGLLPRARSSSSISKRFSDLQFNEVVNRSAVGHWGKVGWKISKLGFLGVCCVSVCAYVLTQV